VAEKHDGTVIELTDATKAYRTGDITVEALRGVSLTVRAGEYVALMGKTTLLGILGCLDRPTTGSYRLGGQEVATLKEATRARVRGERIGFVFQAYNLLPRSTAYKNVELPLVYARIPRRERRRRVAAALADVGLAERAQHHPNQLSGGQQQRVAVARALVSRPRVVLADEPTGNLDSASAHDVLQLFDRMHVRGATIVTVTHSPEVARRASRVVHIADGQVVSDEPVGPLRAS
jgi:putative ABC transport system ATP-binding protein